MDNRVRSAVREKGRIEVHPTAAGRILLPPREDSTSHPELAKVDAENNSMLFPPQRIEHPPSAKPSPSSNSSAPPRLRERLFRRAPAKKCSDAPRAHHHRPAEFSEAAKQLSTNNHERVSPTLYTTTRGPIAIFFFSNE
jgi:hypothetical protein